MAQDFASMAVAEESFSLRFTRTISQRMCRMRPWGRTFAIRRLNSRAGPLPRAVGRGSCAVA